MTTVNTLQSGGQGTAVPAGYIGEVVEVRQDTAQSFTSANYAVQPITLTSGIWDIQGIIQFQTNGATGLSGPWSAAITLANSNPNESFLTYTTSPNSTALTQTVRVRYDGTTMSINGQTSQTQNFVYLRAYPGSFTGGPVQYKYYLRATRIA